MVSSKFIELTNDCIDKIKQLIYDREWANRIALDDIQLNINSLKDVVGIIIHRNFLVNKDKFDLLDWEIEPSKYDTFFIESILPVLIRYIQRGVPIKYVSFRWKNKDYDYELETKYPIRITNFLKDKQICITGELFLTRDEYRHIIEAYGGIWKPNITNSVDYLIIGERVGNNKLEAGKQKGIKIIKEEHFRRMLLINKEII